MCRKVSSTGVPPRRRTDGDTTNAGSERTSLSKVVEMMGAAARAAQDVGVTAGTPPLRAGCRARLVGRDDRAADARPHLTQEGPGSRSAVASREVV